MSYFVDYEEKYTGAPVFGKEIISKGALLQDGSIYLLISRKQYEDNRIWVEMNLYKRYRVINIGEVNDTIKNSEKVYIYGAGAAGKRTLQVLEERGIKIKGFIDSSLDKIGKIHCGYPVFDKEVLVYDDVSIVSTVYYREVCEELIKCGKSKIFVDYRNCCKSDKVIRYNDMKSILFEWDEGLVRIMETCLVRHMYTAIWNDLFDKNIVIYGCNTLTRQVVEVLRLMDMNVSYVCDDSVAQEYCGNLAVKNVAELAYEEKAFGNCR